MAENDKGLEPLRSEILNLIQYVTRMREEIAMINKREDDDRTHFQSVSEHLGEIVGSTEDATHRILEDIESIDSITEEIRNSGAMGTVPLLCNKINEHTGSALEACTFQDLTGQRVTRIIKSLEFVEQRVNAMIDLWGRSDIEALGISLPPIEQRTGDEALLNGPQLPGEEISQDEIDKLFA